MTERLDSPEDICRALTGRLGREPDPDVWQLLLDDEYVAGTISLGSGADDALYSMDELLDRYRRLREFAKTVRGREGSTPRRTPPAMRLPANAAIEAETKIAAIEAADLPEVRAFRERVLGGRLLGWREAHAWLAERFEKRRVWTRIHLPTSYPRSSSSRPNPWEARTAIAFYETGAQLQGGNWADTELDYLHCVCDVLVDIYQWDDIGDEVALFVLTGMPPNRSGGRFAYVPPPEDADLRNGTITMRVSARLGPRELMNLYSDYRSSLLDEGARVREVSAGVAAQAVFIAAANDGRSWAHAMRDWNHEHGGERRYTERRLFTRDCRAAYQRVMGRELGWRGAARGGLEPRGLQPSPDTSAEIKRELWQRIEEQEKRRRERRHARRRNAGEGQGKDVQ